LKEVKKIANSTEKREGKSIQVQPGEQNQQEQDVPQQHRAREQQEEQSAGGAEK
jgi:hypothetical protein